ncbi:DHA2 family efflux MFS transporter permease subunit [Staphylococcus sp. SQ8-PEA]|uniref:DHA2 family efflux MFS transporter permease subunit n=1 Tax=Staphylococcus marylandisciuri TaxID=2981529 RepID=A0ABT2QSA5_9STAP|nr:DHA2 family efflux MFS transporter permease subunit [Staphylococcus marylandisciuri]MCU5746865.1 DHA2 family efflux MFS transporter permease subunit [Staphylococcus marylandisciuri]
MSSNHTHIPRQTMLAAWAIAFAAIAPMLDSTMINIAVNQLTRTFNTQLSTIQWGITGYVLALAIGVPLAGWLMNRFNSKCVFISNVILFGVTSLLAGISWNVISFIIFRAFQGFTAGIITTLMTTLLVKVAGKEHIGKVMAIVSTPMILGPILGPVLGGIVIHLLNWHYLFFINILITIIVVPIMIKVLPRFAPFKPDSQFDWLGISLIAVISLLFIYGISTASHHGSILNPITMACLILDLICILVYYLYSRYKGEEVIIPLSLFHNKQFSLAGIGLFLANIAILGPMIIFPLFFQHFKYYTEIEAALALMPQGIGMLVTRPLIGKWIDQFGAKPIILLSTLFTFIATLPFVFVGPTTSIAWLSLFLFVRGLFVGGLMLPLTTHAYTDLDEAQLPQAGVGINIIENIGSSFGSAIMATTVATVITHFGTTITSQLAAYHMAFLTSIIILLIIFLPSLFLEVKK